MSLSPKSVVTVDFLIKSGIINQKEKRRLFPAQEWSNCTVAEHACSKM